MSGGLESELPPTYWETVPFPLLLQDVCQLSGRLLGPADSNPPLGIGTRATSAINSPSLYFPQQTDAGNRTCPALLSANNWRVWLIRYSPPESAAAPPGNATRIVWAPF